MLDDGAEHVGSLCEPVATVAARDDTASGVWWGWWGVVAYLERDDVARR